MHVRTGWPLAVLAASLLSAARASADFSYTTTISPSSSAFGTASNVQFGSVLSPSGLLGTQDINLAGVADLSTRPDPGVRNPSASQTDTGSIPYTITMHISQVPGILADPTGQGVLSISGILSFTRSDTGGEISTNTVTSGLTTANIGGVVYSIDPTTVAYALPTVNSPLGSTGQGSLSAELHVSHIVPSDTSTPEPASWLLLAGGGAIGLLFRHRKLLYSPAAAGTGR